jgi:hypothetical protein
MAEKTDARTAADEKADGVRTTATADAPRRRARVREQQHVESAAEGSVKRDALGNELQTGPNQPPADRTIVQVIDGEPAATLPDDVDVGPHGIALPAAGEVAGGNIAKVLDPPPDTTSAVAPLTREQAAMQTKVYQQIAGVVARPPEMWGILGPGDRVRGHMLLIDLNSGEKVRAMDGHQVGEGQLYANLRNLPESLSSGDTIERVLG